MKDPRGIVTVLLMLVLVLRPHLSGGTYHFAQELFLIPLLVGLGLLLLVPSDFAVRRSDLRTLALPWVLLLWSTFTLIWAPDPGQGMRDSAALALNIAAFTAVYLLGRDPQRLSKGVNWALGLVVLPVLAVALYQRFFGFDELRAVLSGMLVSGEDVTGLMGVISHGRVFAGFLNPNMLAGFLAIFIPLTFDKVLTTRVRFRSILYLVILLAEGVVLVLSGSMGGTLVAVLAVAGVFFARNGINRKAVAGIAVTAVLLAGGLLLVRGLDPIFGSESSIAQRVAYATAGVRMAAAHPGLGWGAGASPGALMGYVGASIRPVADPHNFIVRTWVELGIPGLLILGTFFWRFTGVVFSVVRATGLKLSADGYVGFLFAAAAFILHSIMDMDFFVPETALFGWCAMGGLLALSVTDTGREPGGELPLLFRQTMGGIALFAVLPALVALQGESFAFRGMKNYQSGHFIEAAQLYSEAGKLMPFNGRVALEEGRARFTVGEKAEAMRLFQKANRLMAKSPYPQWELGRAAQAEARWDESLPYLETVHDRYPTSPRILIDLARSHLNMEDQAAAAAYLEEAITVAAFDSQAMELARKLLDRMPNRMHR